MTGNYVIIPASFVETAKRDLQYMANKIKKHLIDLDKAYKHREDDLTKLTIKRIKLIGTR